MLYALLAYRYPFGVFRGDTGLFTSNMESIGKAQFTQSERDIEEQYVEMVEGLLEFDPDKRITLDDALKSPYWDSVEGATVLYCKFREREHATV